MKSSSNTVGTTTVHDSCLSPHWFQMNTDNCKETLGPPWQVERARETGRGREREAYRQTQTEREGEGQGETEGDSGRARDSHIWGLVGRELSASLLVAAHRPNYVLPLVTISTAFPNQITAITVRLQMELKQLNQEPTKLSVFLCYDLIWAMLSCF